jgi:hypothetical protein
VLTTTRRWLWVLTGSVAVACSLNPQPDLPGDSGTSAGNTAGGNAAPTAGAGNVNLGGSSTTAGTSSGGTVGGAGEPSSAAGAANAGGEASGGDGSGGAGGDGGEAGDNASGTGHRD